MLAALAVQSCNWRDAGILDPEDPDNFPVLLHFQGRAFNQGDTSISASRLLNLRNPRIELVWQSIGPKEYKSTPSQGSIRTQAPFDFSSGLLQPPQEEVLQSPDLAVGIFWLYSDVNGNGALDRLISPDMLKLNLRIDSIYARYTSAMEAVKAEAKENRVDVSETYYVGRSGTLILASGDSLDTLWLASENSDPKAQLWSPLQEARVQVLSAQNRWERFFSLRKRANDRIRDQFPVAGYAFGLRSTYERKLFPRPGREAEFESRVREATQALVEFGLQYTGMIEEAQKRGLPDYPYSGYGEEGQDWVAGRSRENFVLYFKDRPSLIEMLDAEANSSFVVKGREKLHVGYNLIRCDDQYSCQVMGAGDSVYIALGQSDAYFNPPSSPLKLPETAPEPVPAGPEASLRLEGSYRFKPFNPFVLKVVDGGLWAETGGLGLFALLPAGPDVWFSPAMQIQIQPVSNTTGLEKLLVYAGGKRFVAVPDSAGASGESDLEARVRSWTSAIGTGASSGSGPHPGGRFDFGGDTLSVQWTGSGDSLLISVPGMLPNAYHPASDSGFRSRFCDCALAFRRNDRGDVTDAVFSRGGNGIWAPDFDYAPRSPEQLFPGMPSDFDSLASESDGSGRDTYAGLDGKGRYATPPDERLLQSGDGWIEILEHSLPGDSVSLYRGGDGLRFSLRGLKGFAAKIELRLAGLASGEGRARLRLRGGDSAGRQEQVLADDFWIRVSGDTSTVTLGPFPVASDPFYVRLERVPVADSIATVAFDSYRIRTQRRSDAGN